MALVAMLALLLVGCGLAPDNETPTPFGPGTAPPTATAAPTAESIPGFSGGAIGQFAYDAGYFPFPTPYSATAPTLDSPLFAAIATGAIDPLNPQPPAGGVALLLSVIVGRPDTPCRYQAALAARDDGYTIQGDGAKRINDQQVEFAEVLLNDGSIYWRLDCAELTGNLGIAVWGIADAPDMLGTEPVHQVLNSIRP